MKFRLFTACISLLLRPTGWNIFYYIDPKNDSITYAGGQNGLYFINSYTGTVRNISPGINYYHSFTDPKGNNIVSNDNGSFVWRNNRLIPLPAIYKEFSGKQFVFNCHVRLNDSVIALGTRNFKGVIIWQPGKGIRRILDDNPAGGLSENVINALYVDKKRNLWVAGDQSLTVFNGQLELVKNFSPVNSVSKKAYSLFFDMYDSDSLYYVASYGQGVIVLDKTFNIVKELTTGSGLSSNSTYKLLPYQDSLLFVTSNNGLSVFHLKDADRYESYFESDGLQSNSFEENTGAVFNGHIYAGGTRGLSIINPSLLNEKRAGIPLFFDNLVVDMADGSKIDTIDVRLAHFNIPNNVTQTRLTFSAPVFFQSSKIEYQYRIKELHEHWIDLGNRNAIFFVGLAPGKYTIYIRARYPSEEWPEKFLTTTLVFSPKWFQTLAFKLAVLALIIGAVYFLYRFRITQMRKQEQIRKSIAIDLHDDIGSNLNSIKIFTHLAIKEENPQQHLTNIEESLTQTSAGLRDMIWILDDSKDTVEELVARIKKFAHPLCLAKNIELSCTIESDKIEDLVTKSEKRNLLLIAKEVINNAIKYANSSKIELTLSIKAKRKKLVIRDNGDGFDTASASAGNGLKNIQHRASQLRWLLVIESNQQGTVVTIET
ncbi:MAG: triple tyrosine motif-containing protein [Chitinophagaceae bacterium]